MQYDFSGQRVIVTGAAHGFGRAIAKAFAGLGGLIESLALWRLGSPADIAHAVVFLASEHAGWVTGQVLSVDGGRM